jgi:succinate dehydrogenase/fumarate reductase-like Fe-S protein
VLEGLLGGCLVAFAGEAGLAVALARVAEGLVEGAVGAFGGVGDDGITNCGNAQNCVRVCPMSIPLTKAIYEENRERMYSRIQRRYASSVRIL